MQSSNEDFTSEVEYLKCAAAYVGGSDIESAISLLERARLRVPITNRLLNALGKLYLSAGKAAQAAECFQSVLNRKPRFDSELNEGFPVAEDFEYLAEQSHQLSEREYSFEASDENIKVSPSRKILTFGVKKTSQCKKIVFKNKSPKPINKDPEVVQILPSELIGNNTQSFYQNAPDDESPPVDRSINEEILYQEFDRYLSINSEPKDDEDDLSDIYGISIVDQLDMDIDDQVDEVAEFGEDIEFSSQELGDLAVDTDWSLGIYEHWSDDQLDDTEAVIEANGALEDLLSREQRARQAAISCIETIDWDKSSLSFLTEVFIVLGWNNARKAIEREALSGATYEELKLAFHIKQIWGECERYWISFTGAWLPGETTSATYRHCSWRQSLRLIRLFDGIPCSEEVWDLVESEFEFWYGNSVLRTCFPAFSKYLFNYRFNESLPTLPVSEFRRFDISVGFDEMNAPWSYHSHSDQIRKLSEYGIDVINRYSPKSYYVSDTVFDPRDLDEPTSKKKLVETVFDNETV